jgi:hypothetical protein
MKQIALSDPPHKQRAAWIYLNMHAVPSGHKEAMEVKGVRRQRGTTRTTDLWAYARS